MLRPGGKEENTDDLSLGIFLVLEIAIEWRLGGDNPEVSLGGEPGGVSLGVVLSDDNRRPSGMPCSESRIISHNKKQICICRLQTSTKLSLEDDDCKYRRYNYDHCPPKLNFLFLISDSVQMLILRLCVPRHHLLLNYSM